MRWLVTESECVVVLTTLPADADAVDFATRLVEERLAACVNVNAGMTSVYRWEEGVARDHERQIVIKTTTHRLGNLRDRLRQLHPYDIPEFIVLSINDGSEAYLEWMRNSTATHDGR
jgi:periplasmic divalent cation tolerance protein